MYHLGASEPWSAVVLCSRKTESAVHRALHFFNEGTLRKTADLRSLNPVNQSRSFQRSPILHLLFLSVSQVRVHCAFYSTVHVLASLKLWLLWVLSWVPALCNNGYNLLRHLLVKKCYSPLRTIYPIFLRKKLIFPQFFF